jgi:putative transposase
MKDVSTIGLDIAKHVFHAQGVAFITSDARAGLKAARKAVLPGARWQPCQCHLPQNAIHHAPNIHIRAMIGEALRDIGNAPCLPAAEAAWKSLVGKYQKDAPKRAAWLESALL